LSSFDQQLVRVQLGVHNFRTRAGRLASRTTSCSSDIAQPTAPGRTAYLPGRAGADFIHGAPL
jgi:hypothetical protein